MLLNVYPLVAISMTIAINSHFSAQVLFLAILALSFAMAADAESSTAIVIHLHTLVGIINHGK